MKLKFFSICVMTMLLFTTVHAATDCNLVTQIPPTECEELLNFYNVTDGPNWTNNTGWNDTNTPCSWFGVVCNTAHVTVLTLYDNDYDYTNGALGNNLTGSIPDLNLPHLSILYLHYNQLSGEIPNFTNLPQLQSLFLIKNQLTGTIPSFSHSPNLKLLHLGHNQLEGNIPDFGHLVSLEKLWLNNNNITGTVPDFTTLSHLQTLALNENQLTGTIPNFSNLSNLEFLSLNGNQLEGNIPNFVNLTSLQTLWLYDNKLTGTIPNFTSFNLSSLLSAFFRNNCGLTAFDSTQASLLTTKDPDWEARNTTCPTFALTVNKIGYGSTSGSGSHEVGISVNLTATPDTGYTFDGWTPAPCANTFMMPNNNLTCTANFTPSTFAISVTKVGNGSVSSSGNYTAGSTVTLTATPATGYIFSGWTPSPCANSFVMPNETLTCTAIFELGSEPIPEPDIFTVLLNKIGRGQIGGNGNYETNSTVNLTAIADDGYIFTGWSPAPCAPSFTMPNNALTCTATFELQTTPEPNNTFTLSLNQTGQGQIAGAGNYTTGTTVNLTATPDTGYHFTKWTPEPCASSFLMPDNSLTCTAIFESDIPIIQPTFTVSLVQTEYGQISGNGEYNVGDTVNLTAIPNEGYIFEGWTPSPCADNFVMPNSNLTCNAQFVLQVKPEPEPEPTKPTFAVSVDKIGNGQVNGNGQYHAGDLVTLTAIPDEGYKFRVWNPTPCNSSFIMPDRSISCTASFVPKDFAVTLMKTGKGQINGNGRYAMADMVNLTAIPDEGYQFMGWTPEPCANSFVMPNRPLTCIATFILQQPTDCNNVTEIPVKECQALLTLYQNTDGNHWKNNNLWNQTNKPCQWYGVVCTNQHVVGIGLPSNQLHGSLPDLTLPYLNWFILSDNQLTGQLTDFQNFSYLVWLFLGNNQFTGSVPDFAYLAQLQLLDLSNNQLTGIIPDFSHLSNLRGLYLADNQFSGEIPNFTQLPYLQALDLSGNQLSSTIPNFSYLPNLQSLYLFANQLTGIIPNFTQLPNLQKLSLTNNQLTGDIPTFSQLPKLQYLELSYNQLSGLIPNFPTFSRIWLNNNCGFTPYNAAQEIMLNNKDAYWNTINPQCDTTKLYVAHCIHYDANATPKARIPCITVDGINYQAEINQLNNVIASNPHFKMTLKEVSSANPSECITFTSKTSHQLRIDCVTVMNETYWVEMEQINSSHANTMEFELIDFGQ